MANLRAFSLGSSFRGRKWDLQGLDTPHNQQNERVRDEEAPEEHHEASAAAKFKLLLWKNFKIQTRHKVQTVIELLIPLVFTVALSVIRILIDSEQIPEPTIYEPFSLKGNPPEVIRDVTHEIFYSPSNRFLDELMKRIDRDYFAAQGLSYTFTSFPTERKLSSAYKKSVEGFTGTNLTSSNNLSSYNITSAVLAGIIFDKFDKVPPNIKYSLKFPAYQRSEFDLFSERFVFKPAWFTESIYPLFRLLGPRSGKKPMGGFPGYFAEGFLYLQYAIDSSITRMLLNSTLRKEYDEYDIKLQRFPYPSYIDDKFVFAMQLWMPFFITLSFVFPVMNITKQVVHEKETRLKEFMKMMGLPSWLHWTAWFIKAFLFLIGSLILMTILLKLQFANDRSVLTESSPLVILVVFIAYSFSLIGFAFFMSTLFASASSASTAAGFMWVILYMPYTFLFPRINTISRSTKIWTCFLVANIPLSYACQLFSGFEGTGTGLQWKMLNQGLTPDDSFCMADCIVMMIVNGLVYLVSAFYIEVVWPGQFGVALPWYFPFTKWFWTDAIRREEMKKKPRLKKVNSSFFETDPPHLKPGIQMIGLTKIFGSKTAVNNVNLKMFENQITALLGHNGAGKTTTMSMLTGLISPSRGTAIINNYDICTNMRAVRCSLGLCPQYDVLFDELTVEEHLKFYCKMKGYDAFETSLEIERMLSALGFGDKRHAQACTLSGGMKRKLSVGIAFCAGSKVVLLDEPTSGMDPGARRSTWDLIQTGKIGRTVVISTHYMDEAELLGDRIAIMAEGQPQCFGSSLFLKKKYGGDYSLVIVKQPQCNVEDITSVIQQSIPVAKVNQNVGAELSYSLPEDYSNAFPTLFEELEQRKQELGIASYGVGITSMEEVFMRVGHLAELAKAKKDAGHNQKNAHLSIDNLNNLTQSRTKLYQEDGRNSGLNLFWQQFKAMLTKKILFALRNRNLALLQMGIPVIILTLAMIAIKSFPALDEPEAHFLTLDRYESLGNTTTAISCNPASAVCKSYIKLVANKYRIELVQDSSFVDHILEKQTEDLGRVNSQYIVGFEQRQTNDHGNEKTELVGFFNNQPFHTPPLALNMMTNAILRSFGIKHKISVTNFPFTYNAVDTLKQSGTFYSVGFMVGWSVSFGISFLAASFIIFPTHERQSKAKHLQFVAGIKIPLFWGAGFIVDLLNYMIPCVILLIIIIMFKAEAFYPFAMQCRFLVLFFFYGWAVIPLMSLMSLAFTIPSSGYARMVSFNASVGLITMLAVIILSVPEFDVGDLPTHLHNLFLCHPNYALGMGLVYLTGLYDLHENCGAFDLDAFCPTNPDAPCCEKLQSSYFAWKPLGLGRNIFALFMFGSICTIILFLIESKLISKKFKEFLKGRESLDEVSLPTESYAAVQDSDVLHENYRINNSTLSTLFHTDNIVLKNVTKIYGGTFLAVDNLNLGVKKGETFGLLGVNGAGKTTTFKMLTGDISISRGDAYLASTSVRNDIEKVHENIGYCPQFDAVIEQLTGRETIRMFARLKGIKEDSIDSIVDQLAENLLFAKHIDNQVGAYSGGNKRKLSTALAMLGNPVIVFLDEPSAGMDPVARRHLWNAVSRVREGGTSVVITSHSMEECEALCGKLGIMVNGRFRCLGSPQHLKNKFGEGYTIVAQLPFAGYKIDSYSDEDEEEGKHPWELQLQDLQAFIEKKFPGCVLKDSHPGFVQYHVLNNNLTWAKMFAEMEQAKSLFNLDAYSVGQTSLEQVFFNFTKGQKTSQEITKKSRFPCIKSQIF